MRRAATACADNRLPSPLGGLCAHRVSAICCSVHARTLHAPARQRQVQALDRCGAVQHAAVACAQARYKHPARSDGQRGAIYIFCDSACAVLPSSPDALDMDNNTPRSPVSTAWYTSAGQFRKRAGWSAPGRSRLARRKRGQSRARRARSWRPARWPCRRSAARSQTARRTGSSSRPRTRRSRGLGTPPPACATACLWHLWSSGSQQSRLRCCTALQGQVQYSTAGCVAAAA